MSAGYPQSHLLGQASGLSQSSSPPQIARYPESLTRTSELPHALRSYRKRIDQNAGDLFFARDNIPLHFYDTIINDEGALRCHPTQTQGLSELQAHLDVEAPKRLHRSVFVRSASSRDPLAYSREEIDLLLQDGQVMASFVHLLLTFRQREKPHSLATFRVEDHLGQASRASGFNPLIRTQHCFNVLGVEKDGEGKWQPRQVAFYHAFDILGATSSSIIIKGNDEIRHRFENAAESVSGTIADLSRSRCDSFRQTLDDHLLILQWCSEGWPEYMEFIEKKCREVTVMTRFSGVSDLIEDAPKWQDKQNITPATPSVDQNTGLSSQNNTTPIAPSTKRTFTLTKKVTDLASRAAAMLPRSATERTMQPECRPVEFKHQHMRLTLKEVFENLQQLRRYVVQIRDMVSRIEQSVKVVESIASRYHGLVRSRRFTQHMSKSQRSNCRGYSDEFEAELLMISERLQSYRARLQTIHDCTEHEGEAFNHIYQACSMSTSEYFATSGRKSTESMQIMTERMETMTRHMHHKTVSIHVITIFTLIFLPGTFVATVFSSGMLTFGEEGQVGFGSNLGDWKVRVAGVKLFFTICAPLLFVTLCAWFAVYWLARNGRQPNAQALGDPEKVALDGQTKPVHDGQRNGGSPTGEAAPAARAPASQPGL